MRIRKILSILLFCILCGFGAYTSVFAAGNVPMGDVGEYGNWITKDNMNLFNDTISSDTTKFQQEFQTEIKSSSFVPIEVKIGLMFMKGLSAVDSVLQMSFVRFTILFLIVMYAFWIGLNAYKMIRDSDNYKKVVYDIIIQGLKIAVWILILNYGPAKIFSIIISPIIAIGIQFSDFILNAVATTYKINIPDTCATIHQYVDAHNTGKLLIDADTAANIMCLPGRISTYFYHAVATAFDWIKYGFTHSVTAIAVGIVSIYIFIKCIFKYAFMTLGIVTNLFLTLLMLPFTALAETMPNIDEKNYVGQVYSGFVSLFKTKKISEVIMVFVNTAIYFVSLAIIIAICAALLTNLISIGENAKYVVGSAMTTILTGCLILYLADKADKLATKVGGAIDNSFGEQLKKDAKRLWDDTKKLGKNIAQSFAKK